MTTIIVSVWGVTEQQPVKGKRGRKRKPLILTCLGCGGQYTPTHRLIPKRPFCSDLCRESKKFQRTCAGCGAPFRSTYIRQYCSRKCRGATELSERRPLCISMWNEGKTTREIAAVVFCSHQRVHQILSRAEVEGLLTRPVARTPPKPKDYGNCECGNPLPGPGRKFCSRQCAGKSHRTDSEWSRQHMVTLTCNGCGKEFQRYKYLASMCTSQGAKNTYCNLACYHKRGQNASA